MNLLQLKPSFFKKWITSVYKSNYFETLVALEAPSSAHSADLLKENKCCEG